jgi:DNA repair exonuclease SbcCD ATPase subunit
MKRHLALIVLLCTVPLHAAPEKADPATQLREQLRNTMLQLRKAQTDTANAQALQAVAESRSKELETKIADLEKRVETLAKQSNKDKAASDESIAALNNKLAERDSRIAQYTEALEKWKDGYRKAAAVAREKEEERATLASEAIVLKRTVADRETKNIALFNAAIEILDRFENYSMGKALGAREPFIGKSRVKVENLVQGYKDRIIDNRISAPAAKP